MEKEVSSVNLGKERKLGKKSKEGHIFKSGELHGEAWRVSQQQRGRRYPQPKKHGPKASARNVENEGKREGGLGSGGGKNTESNAPLRIKTRWWSVFRETTLRGKKRESDGGTEGSLA